MTQTFENWTIYDNWLIQNYEQYAVTDVKEVEKKIIIEYIEKSEWDKKSRESDNSK